ncbi:hypothetical protein TWF106_006668 [Orbilia oligospora]|uniref:RRM domain-containing protein n=1 Tax=Orbilia oligospora TaxID=2813651 RepID=A0A6G1M3X8_ORBOL|nr:hypothetical protein TWF788_002134 [Orbilia oligospora]KAF3211638.1 hypothetical protein TWF191_010715 [Orbilia oligospora]KAF3220609.1 hypothetical protein TWF106_006668 [Orbilia oligospora]KAF3243460.1 hypothetical protein TWF192_008366 [Orbilia oligospora]
MTNMGLGPMRWKTCPPFPLAVSDFSLVPTLTLHSSQHHPNNSIGERTGYGNRSRNDFGNSGRAGSFGGPGADGYSRRPELPLPTKPPFTAHVGNLSFDATEDDISDYFAQCDISNVRLVRDRIGDRPKGFGYVEFHTLDGLKKALDLNNGIIRQRNVRISVADPPKDRADDRTNVDTWRRAGPLPPAEAPPMRRNNSRYNDNASESGGDNFSRRGSGYGHHNEGDGKFRDYNNWERKGPLPPPTPTDTQSESGRPPRHDRGDRRRSPAVNPFDRERQPSLQGEERSERSERPRREYNRPPAPERVLTAAEKDTQWRRGAKPDIPEEQLKEQYKQQPQTPTLPPPSPAHPPKGAHPPSGPKGSYVPPPSPGAPHTRPKLELKKRSEALPVDANQPASHSDAKSNPFGAARPIDTSAREKEIEEKKAKQIAERKARDEKVKEEKKAAAQAAKAEKAEKKARGEGEPETPSATRSFDLLRRASAANNTDDINPAELDPEEPTETKEELKQPVKATPKVSLPSDQTPKQLEDEEGWSTVKRGRGTNGKA